MGLSNWFMAKRALLNLTKRKKKNCLAVAVQHSVCILQQGVAIETHSLHNAKGKQCWKSGGMPQRRVTSSVWFSHCINSTYHYRVMIHTDNYTYMGSVSACNYAVARRSMTVVRKRKKVEFYSKVGEFKATCDHVVMQCVCVFK